MGIRETVGGHRSPLQHRFRVNTMKNTFVSVFILLALAAPALAQPQSQLRANNNPAAASLPSQIDVDRYKLDITVIPDERKVEGLSLIHISEPTRLLSI